MADLSSVREFLVPKWSVSDPNGLEGFITELRSAKAMQVLSSDSMLIYCSMVKSGKSEILEALTEEQKSDLDEFIAYLQTSFEPTQQERRIGFQRLKQKPNENCVNYFLRTEKEYFRSKNMVKPVGQLFLNTYKEDIKFAYVQGLADKEIKKLMYLNNATVAYEEIATTARNYAVSLRDLQTVQTVNVINDDNEDSNHQEVLTRRSRSSKRKNRLH